MPTPHPATAAVEYATEGEQTHFGALHHLRQTPSAFREIIAGGLAGATAKTCVAPLERCKILFQTGKLTGGKISSTLSNILANEGPRGLFVGNGASVLRIVPYASIHFGLYEYYRQHLVIATYGPDNAATVSVSPLIDLVAGSSAGASAVMATYPLDLVRTRLAFMTEAGRKTSAQHRHTIRTVLADTLKAEGMRGMFRGIGPSFYGILPYAGLKFYVYQTLKQLYVKTMHIPPGQLQVLDTDNDIPPVSISQLKPRLPVPVMLGFGAIAGLIAQTVTYPLDVVRRRMQVEGLKLGKEQQAVALHKLPRSTPLALVAIARQHGWRVLYSGLTINYLKVVPSTAIGFTIYDYLKSALDLPTNL